MRILIVGIATTIVLSFTSCANKGTRAKSGSNNKYLCGAYADYRELTDEDIQIFESAYNYDMKLTPQGVATQIVAGTNFKFICKDESANDSASRTKCGIHSDISEGRPVMGAANDIKVVIFKPLPTQGKAKVVGIETVSGQDTPKFVAVSTQIMYEDIMAMYYSGDAGQRYAFSKYASTMLQSLLDDVDDAIAKGEIEPMVYGWDCDPWIMTQDWNHPIARIEKVHDFSDKSCKVDVVISDGEEKGDATNITLILVKENKRWKVDDFASSKSGINTFVKMLKEDYESAKTNGKIIP